MSPEFRNFCVVTSSFFREVYGHQLTDSKVEDLCSFLSERVTPSDIYYFLEENGQPLVDPDSKFNALRILDFFKAIYPVLLEGKRDEYLQVFIKGILNPLFIGISAENKIILADCFKGNSTFNLQMTAYTNVSFLGRTEFDIARSFNETDKELSERYFRKSLVNLLQARELSVRRPDRYNFGMVGVACHYIALSAVSEDERRTLLKTAIDNLQAAEELGDYSRDHFQYLGYALFEYASIENELSDYFKALNILEIAYEKDPENSNAVVSLARCNLNIGINYALRRDHNGVPYLKNAIFLFDELLKKKHLIGKTYPLGAITGRRSQALFFLWNATHEDIAVLEECIVDLKELVNQNPDSYWTHTLINALIERFLVKNDAGDIIHAKTLSDQKAGLNIQDVEYWRQRGRLYLCNGNSVDGLQAYELFETAIVCFKRGLADLRDESMGYLGLAYGFRGLQFKIEQDLRTAIDYLTRSNYHENQESEKIGILPRLYRELAQLLAKSNPSESIHLFQESIEILKSKELSKFEEKPALVSEITSMIGATYLFKFNLSGKGEDIMNAYEYASMAKRFGMNDPTFYGIFGQICLSIGKSSGDVYEQIDFFREASECFKKSFDLGNKEPSNFSKWGEALFRLNRVNRNRWSLKEALNMFLQSSRLGNDSSENLGLIGDCYYQLSRLEDPVKNLNSALEYKELARTRGHLSKESSSVTGRINLMLYAKTGDTKYFTEGIKSIFHAHSIDPSWPWPVCQLAEVRRDFGEDVSSCTAFLQQLPVDKQLLQIFLLGSVYDLWVKGARLTLDQRSVKEEILGGKSKVFVKKDPYGLVSSTFVFKPGDHPNPRFARFADKGLEKLAREKERVLSFREYVAQFDKKEFLLPTPLEILPLDENIVFSMLRVSGRELGEIILYEDDGAFKDGCVRKTVEYLSIFHSWHPSEDSVPNTYQSLLSPVRNILNGTGKADPSLTGIGDLLLNRCSSFEKVLSSLPLVEKKDAHPENWLVTEDKEIIMIDIEEPLPRLKFLLDDLVQLMDDYPYLPYTSEGWEQRKELIQLYLSKLNFYSAQNKGRTFLLDPERLNIAYLALLYIRGLFIIGLTNRKANVHGHSESSLSRWTLRKSHAFDLLEFVEKVWSADFSAVEAPDWKGMDQGVMLLRKAIL